MLVPMANCILIVSMKQIVRKVEFFGDVIATIDRGENRTYNRRACAKAVGELCGLKAWDLFLKRIRWWSRAVGTLIKKKKPHDESSFSQAHEMTLPAIGFVTRLRYLVCENPTEREIFLDLGTLNRK